MVFTLQLPVAVLTELTRPWIAGRKVLNRLGVGRGKKHEVYSNNIRNVTNGSVHAVHDILERDA